LKFLQSNGTTHADSDEAVKLMKHFCIAPVPENDKVTRGLDAGMPRYF